MWALCPVGLVGLWGTRVALSGGEGRGLTSSEGTLLSCLTPVKVQEAPWGLPHVRSSEGQGCHGRGVAREVRSGRTPACAGGRAGGLLLSWVRGESRKVLEPGASPPGGPRSRGWRVGYVRSGLGAGWGRGAARRARGAVGDAPGPGGPARLARREGQGCRAP